MITCSRLYRLLLTFVQTHFIHFDQDGKITQIWLSWDQGDLLKQVEVIGTRGKNWPVYSGKDQIKMITASTNTASEVNPAPALSPRGRPGINDRSSSPSKKYIKDPHASLDLYREEQEERRTFAPNAVAPRESAKPGPRDMSDIFAAGHEDYEVKDPGGSARKSGKENYIAPKGAAQQKIQPSRLFGEDEVKHKPDRHFYKTNPSRYNHFDIGDADDNDTFQHHDENEKPKDMPIRSKQGGQQRNVPQWGFDGFATPDKVKQKSRGQDVVHFSYEDAETNLAQPAKQASKARREEDTHFEFKDNGTPVMRNAVPQPRKDQVSHFDFNDEATPGPRRIIARTAAAANLYDDPVFGGEEDARPLQTVSHNARKDNDLASHWGINDDSPAKSQPTGRGQMKKGLESHWGADADQLAPKQQPVNRGRKDFEKSFWDF